MHTRPLRGLAGIARTRHAADSEPYHRRIVRTGIDWLSVFFVYCLYCLYVCMLVYLYYIHHFVCTWLDFLKIPVWAWLCRGELCFSGPKGLLILVKTRGFVIWRLRCFDFFLSTEFAIFTFIDFYRVKMRWSSTCWYFQLALSSFLCVF